MRCNISTDSYKVHVTSCPEYTVTDCWYKSKLDGSMKNNIMNWKEKKYVEVTHSRSRIFVQLACTSRLQLFQEKCRNLDLFTFTAPWALYCLAHQSPSRRQKTRDKEIHTGATNNEPNCHRVVNTQRWLVTPAAWIWSRCRTEHQHATLLHTLSRDNVYELWPSMSEAEEKKKRHS